MRGPALTPSKVRLKKDVTLPDGTVIARAGTVASVAATAVGLTHYVVDVEDGVFAVPADEAEIVEFERSGG